MAQHVIWSNSETALIISCWTKSHAVLMYVCAWVFLTWLATCYQMYIRLRQAQIPYLRTSWVWKISNLVFIDRKVWGCYLQVINVFGLTGYNIRHWLEYMLRLLRNNLCIIEVWWQILCSFFCGSSVLFLGTSF